MNPIGLNEMGEPLETCTISLPQIAAIAISLSLAGCGALARQILLKWRYGSNYSILRDLFSGEPVRSASGAHAVFAIALVLACWPFLQGETLTSCRRAAAVETPGPSPLLAP